MYFGEDGPDYSIAPTTEPEIDGPRAGDTAGRASEVPLEEDATAEVEVSDGDSLAVSNQAVFEYDGVGGVQMSSFAQRLLFAVRFREANFLLSNSLTDESRVMFIRDPRDRVAKTAPFLTLDGDPYPAIVDGRMTWIVDGYTTSSGYPYSELQTLGEVTADALTATGQRVALPENQVNYIRNSVKATVDAYDGTVTLYAFDESDPVLQTWMKSFDGTVRPASDISDELSDHFRYPEDLFKVQRELYSAYHVEDPRAFFNEEDFWVVPENPADRRQEGSTDVDQPPYYLVIDVPGAPREELQLTTVFNAADRPNLTAFMAASSDPEDFGTMRVLRLPSDTLIDGPGQTRAQFLADTDVATTINLLDTETTDVELGNLLTLPVEGGLLYVQPVYVQAVEGEQFPLLRRVLVSFGDDIAFEPSLARALDVLFGDAAPSETDDPTQLPEPPDGGDPGVPPPSDITGDDALSVALRDAETALRDAETALRDGDLAAYAAAQARLEQAVQAAVRAQGGATPDEGAAAGGRGCSGGAAVARRRRCRRR